MNLPGVLFAIIFDEVQHLPEFDWQRPFPFSELPDYSCVPIAMMVGFVFIVLYEVLINFRN